MKSKSRNYFNLKQYPNCYKGHNYAIDVIDGVVLANKYIIAAARRYLRDLEEGKYPFKPEAAEKFLRLTQKFKHTKGQWSENNLVVWEPWQCWVFMNVYGFFDKRTGFRRFRTAYLEVARGNGKSLKASACGLYDLSLDNPIGNEVSCFATSSSQSRIVLDSARVMAENNPSFLKATGTEVLAHVIKHPKSNSIMKARSSEHKSLDGLNDKLSIVDELHAVSQELYDVVVSGLKKRRDSLLLCITTAGFDVAGVGYAQSQYNKRVALGEIEDEQTFSAIYTLDEGDDIFDEKNWIKANPNYGISVDPIAMQQTAKKAKEIATECDNFKTKNLNIWLSSMSAYYDINKWDACANKELKESDFIGKRCYAAVDLASRVDLTTYVKILKLDDKYYIFDKSYIPEATVENSQNSTLYKQCVADGSLIKVAGEAIDQDKIKEDILADKKKYRLDQIMFDIWNASGLMAQLAKERLECTEFRMTTANLSEPMKTLDELIRKGKIVHNGSPIMRFCISNVVAKVDANDNVFPRKNAEKFKIDIAVAIMMALAGWIQESRKTGAYEARGIRVL